MEGKKANNPNGKDNAVENPNIPQNGLDRFPVAPAVKSKGPINALVHENETRASVNAIKKIPINPPLSLFASILFTNADGNTISNAPKKDTAKTTNIKKKKRLNQTFVDMECKASTPKITVNNSPIVV